MVKNKVPGISTRIQVSRHFELVNIPYIGRQTASISRFLLPDSSSRRHRYVLYHLQNSSSTSKNARIKTTRTKNKGQAKSKKWENPQLERKAKTKKKKRTK